MWRPPYKLVITKPMMWARVRVVHANWDGSRDKDVSGCGFTSIVDKKQWISVCIVAVPWTNEQRRRRSWAVAYSKEVARFMTHGKIHRKMCDSVIRHGMLEMDWIHKLSTGFCPVHHDVRAFPSLQRGSEGRDACRRPCISDRV